MARRFDVGSLGRVKETPQGFLRVPAFLTRVGVFDYRNPDGTVRRELRLPEEVFHADALASFSSAVVTDDHPPVMVDATNVREYQRGVVSEGVRADGDKVAGDLLVMDASLITKMRAGKKQLSCGYECDLEEIPGTYKGQKYDAVQRNIRGNHVAVVDRGRAGADCSARMDTTDAAMVARADNEGYQMDEIISIDGVEFKCDKQTAQAFTKYDAAMKAKLAASEKDAAREAARADGAEDTAKKERAARTDAAEKFDAAVRERAALNVLAAEHLDDVEEKDIAKMSAKEVKMRVVEKLTGAKRSDLEKRNDDYLDARFDGAVEAAGLERGDKALEGARKAANDAATADDAHDDVANAILDGLPVIAKAYTQKVWDQWKEPIPGARVAEQ